MKNLNWMETKYKVILLKLNLKRKMRWILHVCRRKEQLLLPPLRIQGRKGILPRLNEMKKRSLCVPADSAQPTSLVYQDINVVIQRLVSSMNVLSVRKNVRIQEA